jgi:hypothetical protein
MKFHGIQLNEGSAVTNMTLAAGTAFPDNPNEGELFFRTDANTSVKGMYLYVSGAWTRIIISSDPVTPGTGAVGGGNDQIFFQNDLAVTADYTITTNNNAMTAGPISVNNGVTVTVPDGSTWTIV